MKFCYKCKIEKSLEEFSNNVNERDGKCFYCKLCSNKLQRLNRKNYDHSDLLETIKSCSKCGVSQSTSEFYKQKTSKCGRTSQCKTCITGKTAEYRKANKEKIADYRTTEGLKRLNHKSKLKTKYGLTLDDWNAMMTAQASGCAICQEPAPEGQHLSVDHNHTTGEVRGLLCQKHNFMIGFADDREDVLLSAVEYLRKAKSNSDDQQRDTGGAYGGRS
ncbi:MAG TPA: endonuclease VII domain-containing protein [Methylomirabilota bacterium]|nr:endonuclease VII domain-containing protein [Methylomirabilota bacterium]